MDREAVVIVNSIGAAVQAVLIAATLVAPIELSTEQIGAIVGAIVAVGTVVQTILTRARVYSQATVEDIATNLFKG